MTKILVTESQYQRLFEQKKPKIEVFQDLIDNGLEYIRGFCDETLSAEEYSGDVGFDANDIIKLLAHNKEMVCGAYPMKTIPLKWNFTKSYQLLMYYRVL